MVGITADTRLSDKHLVAVCIVSKYTVVQSLAEHYR